MECSIGINDANPCGGKSFILISKKDLEAALFAGGAFEVSLIIDDSAIDNRPRDVRIM
jgi:hypothetical protein